MVDVTKVNQILERHGAKHEHMIAILLECQEEYSYLPREVLEAVSAGVKIPLIMTKVTITKKFRNCACCWVCDTVSPGSTFTVARLLPGSSSRHGPTSAATTASAMHSDGSGSARCRRRDPKGRSTATTLMARCTSWKPA